jgi:hypothetical protein
MFIQVEKKFFQHPTSISSCFIARFERKGIKCPLEQNITTKGYKFKTYNNNPQNKFKNEKKNSPIRNN